MTCRRRGRTRAIGVGLPLKSATVPNNIGYSNSVVDVLETGRHLLVLNNDMEQV